MATSVRSRAKPKVSIRDLKLYGVGEDSSQLEVSAENAEGITGYWADEGGGESFSADVKVGDGETERRMFTRTAGSTGFGASCDPIASGDTVTVTAEIDPAKAAEYDPGVLELSKTA